MHTEGYYSVVFCMHFRAMVERNSVAGMQCIQKAIVAAALWIHCRPMVEGDSVIDTQNIQKTIVALALCMQCGHRTILS